MSHIALIPARSGSKRISGKNLRLLNGHPLIAYSIVSAIKSNMFSRVFVSSDSDEIVNISRKYGAEIPGLRPKELAQDDSPDIEWVKFAIDNWIGHASDALLAIIRPTSPLRKPETLQDAVLKFESNKWADSLRAMERVSQHPGKMWRVSEDLSATPFLPQESNQTPTHSRPTQSLEKLYVQNASLEVTSVKSVLMHGTISGNKVLSYTMPGNEGFDLNTEEDWVLLNALIKSDESLLPELGF